MDEPRTLTARTPEDLLAAVPCVLGFRPDESLVMLTFGPGPAFHARVDLPEGPDELPLVTSPLCHAVRRNGVRRVVLVAYTTDPQLAADVTGALEDALCREGVEVLEVLHSTGTHWFPLRPGFPDAAYDGVPHDDLLHPFAVEQVVNGRVTHRSRADLDRTLESTDPAAVAEVAAAAAGAAHRLPDQSRPAEAAWVRSTLLARLGDGRRLTCPDAGRLLVALLDVGLRDVAWSTITPDTAARQVDLWADLLRRCPTELRAAPATLLGFAAWLAGSGALAWCALDRAGAVDPDYPLAGLVAQLLEGAVPPSAWEPLAADTLPLLRGGD